MVNPAFLSNRNEANLTIIQIMQQERSFLRRVCVLKPFINENCPSSRRAYFSIRLAVKTSRPQMELQIYHLLSQELLFKNLDLRFKKQDI